MSMDQMTIIVCGNDETLGDRRGEDSEQWWKDNMKNCLTDLVLEDGIDYRIESDYRYWNGGKGYGHLAVVRIDGYGVVKNKKEARSAVIGLAGLPSEPDFPSSEEIDLVFERVEELEEILRTA